MKQQSGTQPIRSNSTSKQTPFMHSSSVQLCKIIQSYGGNQVQPRQIGSMGAMTLHQRCLSPEQTVMTPQRQKLGVFSGIKPQGSDKRNSQSFNVLGHFQGDQSTHATPNKVLKLNFNSVNNENEHRHNIDNLLKENQNLQQTVLKYRNEAEHYKSLATQQQSVPTIMTHRSTEDFNLLNFKSRIENLESVIDQQAQEIERWKEKHRKAQQDEQDEQYQKDLIHQLEGQIMLVIQENEQLNNTLNEQTNQNQDLEKKLKLLIEENIRLSEVNDVLGGNGCMKCQNTEQENFNLEYQVAELEKTVKIQKEEILTWHDNFKQMESEQQKILSKDNEIFQCKLKIQDLENQLSRRTARTLENDRTYELEQQVKKLELEISRLQKVKPESASRNKEKINTLVEEILSQQLFYQEELKRFKTQKILFESARQDVSLLQNQVADLERKLQKRDIPNQDEAILYAEFQKSSEVVQQLLQEIQ